MDPLVDNAVDILYSADPVDFVARRTVLAREARTSGRPEAARRIGGLKRPTRSAWIVNKLVRDDAEVLTDLDDVGAELRGAQSSLDGERIRAASASRRRLVDRLTRQALDGAGVSRRGAARDEVVSTLEAALADPAIAEEVAQGRLLRATQWSGFGAGAPALALVTEVRPAARAVRRSSRADREQAEIQRRADRRQRAEAELRDATARLDKAHLAVDEAAERLRILEEQVADARRAADEVAIELRRARAEHRRAEQSVERLHR